MSDTDDRVQRLRRQPPPLRPVEVVRTEHLGPRMVRLVLGGPALDGFAIEGPASSVRLLVPEPGSDELVMPEWTGNQFELPDGSRAPIRTFTPRYFDATENELTIDVVVAHEGLTADWASSAAPGDRAAISGPGRTDDLDGAASYLLIGDETAIPAIGQLLEMLPRHVQVRVHIEVGDETGRIEVPDHPGAEVSWATTPDGAVPGATFLDAVPGPDEVPEKVWVAGEAAAVQAVRTRLFEELGLPRSQAIVRGYWKHGRAAT